MRRYVCIFLALIPLLSSCDKIRRDGVDEGQYVYLGASILNQADTRAPYLIEAPSGNNPLEVAVWASTVPGSYPESAQSTVVAARTQARFANSDMQLLNGVLYPIPSQGGDPVPVYFVSMYPRQGWSSSDNSTAEFTFNGSQDVMFAPQVSGYYNIQKRPLLAYKHLLTLFNVKIGMDPAEVQNGISVESIREAWGNVVDMYINQVDQSTADYYKSHSDKVTVTLGEDPNPQFVFTTGASISNTKFYKSSSDDDFPGSDSGYEIAREVAEVAYTMCAPVTATADGGTPEYILTIVTKKGNVEREIEIQLDMMKDGTGGGEPTSYSGSTAGKQYDVTLYFKKSRTIRHKVNVSQWETGGYGQGNLEG